MAVPSASRLFNESAPIRGHSDMARKSALNACRCGGHGHPLARLARESEDRGKFVPIDPGAAANKKPADVCGPWRFFDTEAYFAGPIIMTI